MANETEHQGFAVHDTFSRAQWARLRQATPMTLTHAELQELRSLGDVLPRDEVEQMYLPLQRLIGLYISASREVRQVARAFLMRESVPIPYVIGIAGSVGVGKSSIARVLRTLLSQLPQRPRVELVTTDGFLFPNAELKRRGLMQRKGFPESYDLPALVRFLARARGGERRVQAPVYSHLAYDIVPGAVQTIDTPDILIVEGLNLLQHRTARGVIAPTVLVSDFLDFTIYIHAAPEHIRQWYVDRFRMLVHSTFQDPRSHFHRYARLAPNEIAATGGRIWDEINGPNLIQNILPTHGRARLVLEKGPDHMVRRVLLRTV
jgi:type I pantothenate kinase